jgi:hypothetical protein
MALNTGLLPLNQPIQLDKLDKKNTTKKIRNVKLCDER